MSSGATGGTGSESVGAGLRGPAAPSRNKHVALVAATRDGRHSQSPVPRLARCFDSAVVARVARAGC